MKKFVWITRKGERKTLNDMTTEHIYNCMRFTSGCLVVDPVYNKTWSASKMKRRIKYLNMALKQLTQEFHKREKEGR
jgi:hypothetical protein